MDSLAIAGSLRKRLAGTGYNGQIAQTYRPHDNAFSVWKLVQGQGLPGVNQRIQRMFRPGARVVLILALPGPIGRVPDSACGPRVLVPVPPYSHEDF